MISIGLLFLIQALDSASLRGRQQEIVYRITSALDEPSGVLRGRQRIRYLNRSPDSLRTFALRLPLNAFRPGSRWTAVEEARRLRRFIPSAEAGFGFNHLQDVRVDGVAVATEWPFAPDSTLMRLGLPAPLAPGGSIEVTFGWEARLSSPPRHQGRLGRHFDFTLWYPRVADYGERGWDERPLHPHEGLTGSFATFLVELDLADDQVVGATGVLLCGDPGWERARHPHGAKVTYQRTAYREPRDPDAWALVAGGRACPTAQPGRATTVWYAEDVPDFGVIADPDFRYEEGDVFERPVRVLHRPGTDRSWGAGLASGRVEAALVWLDEIFGRYPWPQVTLAEGLESGGLTLPMLVASGGPAGARAELLYRLIGQLYTSGAIGSDAAREEWLSAGLAAFQTTLFFESLGRRNDYQRLEREVLDWDLDRLSVPVAQAGSRFGSVVIRSAMVMNRGELFFHQLRRLIGDPAFRRFLLIYYQRYRFGHADEDALRAVAEETSGLDLSDFFRHWLHEGSRFDYAVRRASRERVGDSLWRTTVVVKAKERGRSPVAVWVYGTTDSARVTIPGRADQETVTVETRSQPRRVAVDPTAASHDWNLLNNQRGFGGFPARRPTERYLGGWFSQRQRRDRLTSAIAPTGWYNDVGGWTFGLRTRDDYLGRFSLDELWLNVATGWAGKPRRELNGRVVIRNPVGAVVPGLDHWYHVGLMEGRAAAGLGFRKRSPRILAPPGPLTWGADLEWLAIRKNGTDYLEPSQWTDAATLELTGSMAVRRPAWRAAANLTAGRVVGGAPEIDRQWYSRVDLTVTTWRQLGAILVRGRVRAGATVGANSTLGANATVGASSLPRQRLQYLAGADPHQRFLSPFLRSRGALFLRPGVNYHESGGADLRGLDPGVAASRSFSVNLEVERAFHDIGGKGLFRRGSVALFGDGALADGDLDRDGKTTLRPVADAGIGIRFDHSIGATPFQTRLDAPLWVSRPELAQDRAAGRQLGWRWTFSFKPAW